MVGAGDLLAGEFVDGACEALGDAAGVDEKDGASVLVDDFEQAGVDALPDAGALGALAGWAAGSVLDFAEAGHVFDGDLDGEFEGFACAGVDDGDGTKADAFGGGRGRGFRLLRARGRCRRLLLRRRR